MPVSSSSYCTECTPRDSGFSDPVYAEAVVNIQQFDIVLGPSIQIALLSTRSSLCTIADVLIVNQTNETLQDLTIEFATLGDLKLVERPAAHTLGPLAFHNIKATIKVRN
jgi:coatomer subunit beta